MPVAIRNAYDVLTPNALFVLAKTLSAALEPPERIAPSVWAAKNIVVPDGPLAGQLIDLEKTPYLKEILDFFSPDSPVNEVAVRKSAQSAFTTLMLAIVGFYIDCAPCNIMLIQPTDSALSEFNSGKLNSTIAASDRLFTKVAPQASRSGEGSTTYIKKFPGGRLYLTIATSAADLSSKTVKILLRDEIDRYPDDLEQQGSPLEISDGRLISFLSQGDWKKLDISTPTIKGSSKIDERFEKGDQRFLTFACPGCQTDFCFEWGANFKFNENVPHNTYYCTPCCGSIIENYQRAPLLTNSRWVARNSKGRYPSYHFDALTSPFVPWDNFVATYLASKNNDVSLKTFYNLWLGLPFEVKGDAPDYVKLMERREDDVQRGHVPAIGLMLVGAADIQEKGIWFYVKAFAPDRQSWLVEAKYLDGDTASHEGGAFVKLREEIKKPYLDAWGNARTLDAMGIDTGYRAHAVYAFVRQNQCPHDYTGENVLMALKGMPGWGTPPIGTPRPVDIKLNGRKIPKGVQLWPVGTWSLKGAFYADLRRDGKKAGQETDPPGYCHFGTWVDEYVFRQLTAEHLIDEIRRGRKLRVWQRRPSEKDNHFLDCEVYCRAMAEYLGLSRMGAEDWAKIAKRHHVSQDDVPPLFAQAMKQAATGAQIEQDNVSQEPKIPPTATPAPTATQATMPATNPYQDWISVSPDWLKR